MRTHWFFLFLKNKFNENEFLGGFRSLTGSGNKQPFTIQICANMNPNSLPVAHVFFCNIFLLFYFNSKVCFNRLDIPPYKSYNIFLNKMETALELGMKMMIR
jgi:hypothetical protein